MNILKRKITSERGASITFALLIFLVCSMVSIAVVIAGTTAAGRMSQRAETDQRYYAVTSAVELLCDDFKGKIVTVEYTKNTSTKAITDEGINVSKIVTKKDSDTDIKDSCGIVERVSKDLITLIATNSSSPGNFSLIASASTPPATDDFDYSTLGCTIKEYVKPDGRVVFEVFNTVDPAAIKKQVYTLQVTFDANISQSSSQYTSGETRMEKYTTTLKWSLNSIKKGAV